MFEETRKRLQNLREAPKRVIARTLTELPLIVAPGRTIVKAYTIEIRLQGPNMVRRTNTQRFVEIVEEETGK